MGTVWTFNGTDGGNPSDTLILDGGNLYGTTYGGGTSSYCPGAGGCGVAFEVNPSPETTNTTLTSSPNPSNFGEAVTFTAAVTPQGTGTPTGTVSFFDGKSNLGASTLNANGIATLTISSLAIGTDSLTASYSSDINFESSTSPVLSQIVLGTVTATLSTTSLSFGNEALNDTSNAKWVTVTNTGTGTLDITSITASGNFAISSNTCGSTVAAGKKCTVHVTFTPAELGALTGTLTFNDNAANSPQTVALSGTGVEPATISPTSYAFEAQDVGVTSEAHKFTLTNNQTATLTGITSSTTGDFAVSLTTCSSTLDSKKSCSISVTFTPTTTGTRTGTLTVSDSASNTPQTASLTGTGNNPKPTITSLSPSSATAGGAQFTLTVNGANFVTTSVVNWAGSPRTTTYMSGTKISATINAADIATPGTFKVTVTNPSPGGGTSASSNFTVNHPLSEMSGFSLK